MDVTFDETSMRMNGKYMKVQDPRLKVDKTRFEVHVPTSETIDEDEVETSTSSYREWKPTVAPDYVLARDKVQMDVVPPKRNYYVDHICYDSNMV